jgi:YfiH family protein
MFTRLGGYSLPPWASLNTGHTVGDDLEAVEANHQLICQALSVRPEDIVSPHQVHGATVAVLGVQDRGRVIPDTDALITNAPQTVLMLRFADCVPVLLYDPIRHAIGLAHAGWRGTVSGVAQSTVHAMQVEFGSQPADIVAGIGPSIGPCCYEVGEDVAEAFRQVDPGPTSHPDRTNQRWYLDLWAVNRDQLREAGVQHVEVAEMCTACRTDEWYSHRAEGGRTGRWAAVIALRDESH